MKKFNLLLLLGFSLYGGYDYDDDDAKVVKQNNYGEFVDITIVDMDEQVIELEAAKVVKQNNSGEFVDYYYS